MENMASMKEVALSLRVVVLSLMAMGLALVLASGVAHAAAPSNDDFANAQEIPDLQLGPSHPSGIPGWHLQATVRGTNVGATKESGEPDHAGNVGGTSVWYEWTAQESGTTFIDTFGSDFNTLLGVYTGSAMHDLTHVASNDDAPSIGINGNSSQSWVRFTASAGTTYRIAVDGYTRSDTAGASSGSIVLNVIFDNDAPGGPRVNSPANNSFDTDGSFVVSGTAEPWARVKLYEGDTLKGSDWSSLYREGWRIGLNDVPDGSHTYTATATDEAGNTSAESEALTVIVDTIAPDAPSITTPAENARFNVHSLTLSGIAEEGAKVELFEGEVSKRQATTGSDGAWSIDLTEVAEGSHSYKVKATDRAGNVSAESEARTVMVDTTAPSVEGWTPEGKKVAPRAKPTVTFSEKMNETSVEASTAGKPTTFILKKGTTVIPASVIYTETTTGAFKATLKPNRKLKARASYTATVRTDATDEAGNALDQDPNLSGNQEKVWSFKVRR